MVNALTDDEGGGTNDERLRQERLDPRTSCACRGGHAARDDHVHGSREQVGLQWDHKNPNDRKLIGQLLGEVSRQEYSRGRPLLTAVVVMKGEDMPGAGFRGLEGFPESDEFYETELRRVHDF